MVKVYHRMESWSTKARPSGRGTRGAGGAEKGVKKNAGCVVSWTTDGVRVAASGDLAVETGSITMDPDGEGKKPADRARS